MGPFFILFFPSSGRGADYAWKSAVLGRCTPTCIEIDCLASKLMTMVQIPMSDVRSRQHWFLLFIGREGEELRVDATLLLNGAMRWAQDNEDSKVQVQHSLIYLRFVGDELA